MNRCVWCGQRIVNRTVCGFCEDYEELLKQHYSGRRMTSPAEHAATVREALRFGSVNLPDGPAHAALDALEAQAEAAQREADIQMGAKLAAQMTLKAVCDVLNLPMVSLGNGWTEATPKIIARIEEIVDEADRAFRERDEAIQAIDEMSHFPRETVFAWKRRSETAEALMRYARMLLDPERQDEPDEENALRAYEVLSGIPLSVPVDADNQRFRDEAVSALLRAEAAEQRATDMERVLRELVDAVRIIDVMHREPAAKGLMSAEDYRSYLSGAWLGVDEKVEQARAALSAREEAAVCEPSTDPVYVRRLWWRIDRNRRITRHLGFCRWCGRWGCGDD